MGEINLVVAKADIEGDVHLEPEAPATTEGITGHRLAVKFPYRYEEVSQGEDNFRLQLTSRLGDLEAVPATFEHYDRRGIADDKRGFIMQEYELPPPGEHELTWRAAVEYSDDGEVEVFDCSGTVKIVVKAADPEPF